MSSFVSLSILGIAGLGMTEMMIIGIIAVLLFGKKLPEVAKQLGGSYREFKKGISDIHSQFDTNDYGTNYNSNPSYSSPSYEDYDDYEEASAPKFDPPPSEPSATSDSPESSSSGESKSD